MTTLVHLNYSYDRSSNRTHRRDELARSNSAGFDQLYGYDGLNRLTSLQQGTLSSGNSAISSPTLTQDWSLDQTGNWSGYQQGVTGTLNQTRTHNRVNEITGISETVGLPWIDPAHDANGNMTTIPQPEQLDEGYTATYDAWNRLVKLEEDDGAGGLQTVVEYQYDGLGRRTVKKTYSAGALDETRHAYFSDQWQVLEERVDSSTTADKQYVWGQRYVDDLVLRDTPGERLYTLQDALFNVVAITDDTGSVKERFAYQPYGQSEGLDPDFSSYSGTDYEWEYRFTGRELDLETGLQINRNRYLHLQLGRWVTRDPLDYADGPTLLAYAQLRPTRERDPSGLAVPTYDDSDVTDCITILRDAVRAGRIRNLPCSRQLLYWFLYGNMEGRTVCPEGCQDAISGANWGSILSQAVKGMLTKDGDCGANGKSSGGPIKGSHCFGGGDLFYSLHCVNWTIHHVSCNWSCGNATGCCCDCSSTCSYTASISDTYDFCSSLPNPPDYGPYSPYGLGYTLAKCGCILEDWRKKRGKHPNTFKVACPIGGFSDTLSYQLCYPKPA